MLRKIVLLTVMLTVSSCQQIPNLSETKPVFINGLGALSQLTHKQLSDEELFTVVKTVIRQRRVNQDDARAILDIYQHQTTNFLQASNLSSEKSDTITARDVERCLALILQYENLRDEVNRVTQAAILQAVIQSAKFDESDKFGAGGAAGSLAGVYVNAYRAAAAKDDEEKRAVLNDQQTLNILKVVQGFETVANDIVEGRKTNVTQEQKEQAVQFLTDLKTYNDSLRDDEKILEQNGRLINTTLMTGDQIKSITSLFGVGSGLDYRIRLIRRMDATLNSLVNAMQRQIY